MKKYIIFFIVLIGSISINTYALEPPAGLDEAEAKVIEGTNKSQEILVEVEGKVPEEASKGMEISKEKSRTGQMTALEGINRGRSGFGTHSGASRLTPVCGQPRRG